MAEVLNCPYDVCDAHFNTASFFPVIGVIFTVADMLRAKQHYSIDKLMVMPGSIDDMVAESKLLVKTAEEIDGIYAMVRGITPEYLKSVLSEKVVGMKVNSSQERMPVLDSCYEKHIEVLSENGGILFVHCGRWQAMSSWLYPAGIALKYPSLTVIFGHMGGTHPDLSLGAIDYCESLDNIYFDLSQCRQPAVLEYAVDKVGSKHILFGSDIPWGSYLSNLAFVLDCALDNYDTRNILHKNFERVIC